MNVRRGSCIVNRLSSARRMSVSGSAATAGVPSPRACDAFPYASRDEERIVKTTLHDIASQADMKLSLKVYHFQELSRTSLMDDMLQRDSRYARLKQDLREDVSHLSPAQLVAAMVSCGRLQVREKALWWDLARAVERHTVKTRSGAPGLQHSQICLTMYSLGKAGIRIKDRFYYRLFKLMVKNAEVWTEFDMAWILYAMRKRRLKAFNQDLPEHQMWAKVTINIAAYFRQKLHFISPQGIVFILYEFAKLGLYPGRCIFQAGRRVRKHVGLLNNKALVCLAVTLARFDWPERRLLKRLSSEVAMPRRMVQLHPNMLAVILHSYARLGIRDVTMLENVTEKLARSIDKLGRKYTTMVALSLGRLGVRGNLWKPLAERISGQIDYYSPADLALIAHGFGKVAVRDPNLLEGALADAAVGSVAGFTPKLVACLLDGLTLAGCLQEDVFRCFMEEYIRLGSIGGRQRQSMMARVLFAVVLERKHWLESQNAAWQPLLNRLQFAPVDAPPRPYHRELLCCAAALSLTEARARRRKGPYMVDLHVPVEAHIPATPGAKRVISALAVHLMAEAEFCPLTGELLGPTRLKRRQLDRMELQHIGLRRKEWLALPDTEARVTALETLLSNYVPLRRRPVEVWMSLQAICASAW
ncbi:unnamed protein product [Symbiodinium pilosum]|uniref:RNA-editing substrate-binding complex 6 protein domain-containing protein n=1 Tax=Symbiodinium pilosum TaxID=2952 RepID=A0A812J9W6_SYMPI|nr:unnamed protein product [Symbiodinium pilosum]